MNKEADFAGTFYPEDADKLNELLDSAYILQPYY